MQRPATKATSVFTAGVYDYWAEKRGMAVTFWRRCREGTREERKREQISPDHESLPHQIKVLADALS